MTLSSLAGVKARLDNQHVMADILARNKEAFGHLPGRADMYAKQEEGMRRLISDLEARRVQLEADISRLASEIGVSELTQEA